MNNKAYIKAIEYYLPVNVESNSFLVEEMELDWTAEDIFNKTGIKNRHIAEKGVCASDLAVEAAKKLFSKWPELISKVDYIIFCSQSHDYFLPATACLLQKRLSLSQQCGAIDINQGCSGYIYGLSLAKGLIEANIAQNILFITADTYSKYISPKDKSTRTIFGDAATATWISNKKAEKELLRDFVLRTNGAGAENLIVKNGSNRNRIIDAKDVTLYMDGPEIFQFTLQIVPKTVNEILDKAGITKEKIDYFVFHQANRFILEYLRKKLKVPSDRFYINMEETGNTVSSSIPIALFNALQEEKISSGMKVMLLGFGVGYSWGGCIIEI